MIIVGDVREKLRELGPDSVHCVVTSPPYWGLRDYGIEGQIGLESSFDDYLETIVGVFAEVRRVLRPEGTLWLNMGDCYASDAWGGSPGSSNLRGGRTNLEESRKARTGPRLPHCADFRPSFRRDRQAVPSGKRAVDRLKPKDLIGMPWRVAFALQSDGWWLRSDIIWHKPSPMPESVRDRPTKAHEYLFLLSKSERYHYDSDAIREESVAPYANTTDDIARAYSRRRATLANPTQGPLRVNDDNPDGQGSDRQSPSLGSTRSKRTVWTVASQPFAGAHFATYPPELIRPCIRAGCPPGGTVLDPFFGAGTTGLVCDQEGVDWIGIEINPEYAEIASARLAEKQGVIFP